MALINKTKNKVIVAQVKKADTLMARMVGLLGTSSLPQNEALWITNCNSIHSFFMKYSIDCIFVDQNLIVRAIKQNISPWRVTLPVFAAKSVFELNAGIASLNNVEVGDQLYVGA